jgi:high-affinity iron transporter
MPNLIRSRKDDLVLPTFVIGLREGLEAALIVGIIAAFLRKQGRRDLLRWVFVGVGAAVVLCVAVGVALDAYSRNLPQAQQEGLETVIGALAVAMVTYMVIWMRRHSRELKGQLEGLAADAITGQSRAGRAMIAMAFLAVLREGFETVVFLLAAFDESGSSSAAAAGAVVGIVVAVALGYGIYRGGVRINLSKFFRATGLVLVLVAAGLVVNALHTAHEAGWLNVGQGATVDLSWLVRPGSVQSSLLTGMLGVQSRPVVIEVVGWLVYLVPVGCYVAWPPGREVPRRALGRALMAVGGLAAVAGIVLATTAPGSPSSRPVSSLGLVRAQLVSVSGAHGVLRTTASGDAAPRELAVVRTGAAHETGLDTVVYRHVEQPAPPAGQPDSMSYARIAALNGGRLPIGLHPDAAAAPVTYAAHVTVTAWVEPRTGQVVDLRRVEVVNVAVTPPGGGVFALADPVSRTSSAAPPAAVARAAAASRTALSQRARHATMTGGARTAGWLGAAALLAGGVLTALTALAAQTGPPSRPSSRRRRRKPDRSRPSPPLVPSR